MIDAGLRPDQFDVTALICDAAQVQQGKLYILGGGWDHIFNPAIAVPVALALLISVPWNRTNEQHHVRAALMTADGRPVTQQPGAPPVMAEGNFEVGRPPGIRPGSRLSVPLAISFGNLVFTPGSYRWEISVDGQQLKALVFEVGGPMAPGMPGQPGMPPG